MKLVVDEVPHDRSACIFNSANVNGATYDECTIRGNSICDGPKADTCPLVGLSDLVKNTAETDLSASKEFND